MMKMIIDIGKKHKKKHLDSETVYFSVCYSTMLTDYLYLKIKSRKNKLYYTENIKKSSMYKKLPFEKYIRHEIFSDYLDEILKIICWDKFKKVLIVCENEIKRAYEIIDMLKEFVDTVFIDTSDEIFFDKLSGYAMEKYGITSTMKIPEKSDITIILNSSRTDYKKSADYIINLSENEIEGDRVLDDITADELNMLSEINIKKCQFLNNNHKNFNLIWRNSQKSVDKSEI